MPTDADSPGVVAEEVARRSYGKLIAILAKRTRDIAAAEDALSEAFATALTDWDRSGVPSNPEAWLLTVARRRVIDADRRHRTAVDASMHVRLVAEELATAMEAGTEPPDERLPLMFACAHPAIDPGVRAPLILQTILGFDAAAIGSAFLVAPKTMGQRLVRAKRKIREAGVPFRVPERPELPERLGPVLESLYTLFSEGWGEHAGTGSPRELVREALWLGRLVVAYLPDEPEALGLLALMLHAEARRPARRDASGEYVPLVEQDPAAWEASMIEEAERLLTHANRLPTETQGVGRFQLEAAIQSAHAVRRFTGQSDWGAVVALYDRLGALVNSPVVAVNRAVALAELHGPDTGLRALDSIADERRLAGYQPFWAARADLLARSGQHPAAVEAYERAIALELDPAVRRFLERRRERARSTRASASGPSQRE